MTTMLLLIDGLRPDAISPDRTPRLAALAAEGTTALTARCPLPSLTLPVHVSLFTGVPASEHGITSNVWRPEARRFRGLFDLVAAAGGTTASFYDWEPLRDLGAPGSLHHGFFRAVNRRADGDDIVADAVVAHLTNGCADFVFVYLGTVDETGHDHGWMSEPYLDQSTRVDAAVGRIVDALPEDAHLVVTADHGGHGLHHGEGVEEDRRVPMIFRGPRFRSPGIVEEPATTLDLTPTLGHLLGLPPEPAWTGRPLDVFSTAPRKTEEGRNP